MKIKHGEFLALDDYHEVMLGIMKAVHNFCVENNIRYSLIYGTLLGAVRHKGFIPWDDDMDIGIPRPDYDRLVSLLNSGKKIGDYYYHLHYTNSENYFYQIIRICDDRTEVNPKYVRKRIEKMGVWVDIFPVDGVPALTPAGIFRRIRLFINKNFQNADIYAIKEKKGICNKFKLLSVKIFPNAKKRNYLIDRLLRETPFEKAKKVGDVQDKHEQVHPRPQSDYSNLVLLPFEDTSFYAISTWDSYLRDVYGEDYMQLPPESKRITHSAGGRWI